MRAHTPFSISLVDGRPDTAILVPWCRTVMPVNSSFVTGHRDYRRLNRGVAGDVIALSSNLWAIEQPSPPQ
jgi:hypothetical protein